jgi:hypothetical protein
MLAEYISCNAGCISQSTTTLLAVARYLKIRSPFLKVNKLVFMSFFLMYAALMTVLVVAYRAFSFYIYSQVSGL